MHADVDKNSELHADVDKHSELHASCILKSNPHVWAGIPTVTQIDR